MPGFVKSILRAIADVKVSPLGTTAPMLRGSRSHRRRKPTASTAGARRNPEDDVLQLNRDVVVNRATLLMFRITGPRRTKPSAPVMRWRRGPEQGAGCSGIWAVLGHWPARFPCGLSVSDSAKGLYVSTDHIREQTSGGPNPAHQGAANGLWLLSAQTVLAGSEILTVIGHAGSEGAACLRQRSLGCGRSALGRQVAAPPDLHLRLS